MTLVVPHPRPAFLVLYHRLKFALCQLRFGPLASRRIMKLLPVLAGRLLLTVYMITLRMIRVDIPVFHATLNDSVLLKLLLLDLDNGPCGLWVNVILVVRVGRVVAIFLKDLMSVVILSA
jgi:hypothetical protein